MRGTQRLDKLLSNSGYGTRTEIRQIIKKGVVRVDGNVIKDIALHVDPLQSIVEVSGKTLKYREFVYVMMNKPEGVISATEDKKLKTVIDILPEEFKNFDLFPVGRLDLDTEGLLILTNDGQITHELLSPKKHVSKKYFAEISGNVTKEDKELFKAGVTLEDGYKTLPSRLEILKSGEDSVIELVIYEGKFHQVKRMFEAVGKKVKYLKRIEMGLLKLDNSLDSGSSRLLSDDEVLILKESIIDRSKKNE